MGEQLFASPWKESKGQNILWLSVLFEENWHMTHGSPEISAELRNRDGINQERSVEESSLRNSRDIDKILAKFLRMLYQQKHCSIHQQELKGTEEKNKGFQSSLKILQKQMG